MKEVNVKLDFPIGKLGKRAMLKIAKAIVDNKALNYIDFHDKESVDYFVTDSDGRQETFSLFRIYPFYSNNELLHFTCNIELDGKCTDYVLSIDRIDYFRHRFRNNVDWKCCTFEKETYPV